MLASVSPKRCWLQDLVDHFDNAAQSMVAARDGHLRDAAEHLTRLGLEPSDAAFGLTLVELRDGGCDRVEIRFANPVVAGCGRTSAGGWFPPRPPYCMQAYLMPSYTHAQTQSFSSIA